MIEQGRGSSTSGSGTLAQVDLTLQIDNERTLFDLPGLAVAGSVRAYRNGQRLRRLVDFIELVTAGHTQIELLTPVLLVGETLDTDYLTS